MLIDLDEIMGAHFILSTKWIPDVVSILQQVWSSTGNVETTMEINVFHLLENVP